MSFVSLQKFVFLFAYKALTLQKKAKFKDEDKERKGSWIYLATYFVVALNVFHDFWCGALCALQSR